MFQFYILLLTEGWMEKEKKIYGENTAVWSTVTD